MNQQWSPRNELSCVMSFFEVVKRFIVLREISYVVVNNNVTSLSFILGPNLSKLEEVNTSRRFNLGMPENVTIGCLHS